VSVVGKSITLIGDSQSEGLRPHFERLFADIGARPVTVISRRGWATRDYLRDGLLDRLEPADIFVVELGGNDAAKGLVGDALEERVRQVVAKLPAREAIFWVGPSETRRADLQAPSGATSRPEASRRIARAVPANVEFIDATRLIEPTYLRDGIHYTRSGYTRFAENLKNEILRRLTIKKSAARPWLIGASLVGAVALGVYFGRR